MWRCQPVRCDSVLSELGAAIDGYEGTKGTLRFPVDTPLPRPLVEQLIVTRMTQLGLEENRTA